MNMSIDEIRTYSRTNLSPISADSFMFNDGNIPHVKDVRKRISKFGDNEELKKLQEKMIDNCNVNYFLMDIINDENDKKLINKIKGKRVFFDTSNIFGYHVSHMCYTFKELVDRFEYFIDMLETHAEYYHLKGTRPAKDKYVKIK